MPIQARRHNPRVKLHETAYINFGSGNRGVILDVSEGGLRFKTASPLIKGADPVRFWLTSFSRRTEGAAAVAWTDESRTVGGLRFTNLPPDIREQVRLWLDRSLAVGEEEGREQDLLPADFLANPLRGEILDEPEASAEPALPGSVSSDSLPEGEVLAAVGAEEAANHAQPTATAVESLPATDGLPATKTKPDAVVEETNKGFLYGRPALVARESTLSMFPAESAQQETYAYNAYTRPGQSSHRLLIAVLVILFALAAAAGAAAYYHPSQARDMMSRVQAQVARLINPAYKRTIPDVEPAAMGSAPEGNSGDLEGSLGPAPPAPAGSNTRAPSADSNSAAGGTAKPGLEASRTADASAPQSAASDNGDAPLAKNNSQVDVDLAQKYLTPGSTPNQKEKAVRLLWLATEKGNIDAEIQLADLYARGDSVPKSCVQARILLKAAVNVNPSLAQPKLAELDDAGCS
jgi:hypothetical protein